MSSPTDLRTRWQMVTQARIGLGRAGRGVPTDATLAFQLDHARARDAVHCPLDPDRVAATLPRPALVVASQASDRATYLTRPDLGRQLAPDSAALLADAGKSGPYDLAIVLADGLSATALHAHGAPLTAAILEALRDWRIAPLVIARHARVALGDEAGAALRARMVLIILGERPGLSAPDSLGMYVTWDPCPVRLDSERNCISNIRPPAGLDYPEAIGTLVTLLQAARVQQRTGVQLQHLSPANPHHPELGR